MYRRNFGGGSALIHVSLVALLIAGWTAPARSMPGGHGGSHHEGPPVNSMLYHPRHGAYPGGGGGGFPYLYAPPIFVTGPIGYYPPPVPAGPVFITPPGGGLMLPNPPQQWNQPPASRGVAKPDPAKSSGLLAIGDNLFRAGNYQRASWRYDQAVKANPNVAAPRVRLAQIALVRGEYHEAAEQIRSASTAEPGWLVNATDIQSLYPEPTDFAKGLAKLESHLQANPTDRDGWLVLGAELYLSGRVRQSADVFARLNDRRPDATLAAFLDATTPDVPAR